MNTTFRINLKNILLTLTSLSLSFNTTISSYANEDYSWYKVSPHYSLSVFNDKIPSYKAWPSAVSPTNVWWIPLELNSLQADAIQAIIKPVTYPDGWQGYDVTIGNQRQYLSPQEFELAKAVGKLVYKPKDRTNGSCTATHVGNNYVVTAGHCIDDPTLFSDTCSSLQVEWHFRRSRVDFPKTPKSSLIGQCQEIVSWSFKVGNPNSIDHTIFRVDKAPEARIAIEPNPTLTPGSKVHQFSHPGGMPLILAQNCNINQLAFQYYQHDCWGASGSSGAALIDASTNKLIGLLSMGSDDTFFSLRNDVSPIGAFDPTEVAQFLGD